MVRTLVCCAVLIGSAAWAAGPPKTDVRSAMSVTDVTELVEASTIEDLTWPRGAARARLEAATGATDALRTLCLDAARSQDTRLKACEALLTLGGTLADADKGAAAGVYAHAIAEGRTHTMWGLPSDMAPNQSSRHIVALGRAALPALRPLLLSDRPLMIEGSEEPTIAKMYGYQVRDLAGALVAAILGTTYPTDNESPAVRAAAAMALHKQIGEGTPAP